MNELAINKERLIAESELNRIQLIGDITSIRSELHSLTKRAESFRLVASSTALIVSGVAGLAGFRKPSNEAKGKRGWLQSAIKGAGLISTLWLAYRRAERPSPRLK